MRLYFKPGACSLSSRIVLTELGLAHESSKVDTVSGGRSYALGNDFSVADAYLFVVLNWCNFIGVDLARWPHAAAFVQRVAARPAVRAAMAREGLIKEAAA